MESECAKPLNSEPASDSDPIIVLNSELCSVKLKDEPRDPVNISLRPLKKMPLMLSEFVIDLNSEL